MIHDAIKFEYLWAGRPFTRGPFCPGKRRLETKLDPYVNDIAAGKDGGLNYALLNHASKFIQVKDMDIGRHMCLTLLHWFSRAKILLINRYFPWWIALFSCPAQRLTQGPRLHELHLAGLRPGSGDLSIAGMLYINTAWLCILYMVVCWWTCLLINFLMMNFFPAVKLSNCQTVSLDP